MKVQKIKLDLGALTRIWIQTFGKIRIRPKHSDPDPQPWSNVNLCLHTTALILQRIPFFSLIYFIQNRNRNVSRGLVREKLRSLIILIQLKKVFIVINIFFTSDHVCFSPFFVISMYKRNTQISDFLGKFTYNGILRLTQKKIININISFATIRRSGYVNSYYPVGFISP